MLRRDDLYRVTIGRNRPDLTVLIEEMGLEREGGEIELKSFHEFSNNFASLSSNYIPESGGLLCFSHT